MRTIEGEIYKDPYSFKDIKQRSLSTDYKLSSNEKSSSSQIVIGLFLEVDDEGCPRSMFDTKSEKGTRLDNLVGSGKLLIEELLDVLSWCDLDPEKGPYWDKKTVCFTKDFYMIESLLRDLPLEKAKELKRKRGSGVATEVKGIRMWFTPKRSLSLLRRRTKQKIRLVSLEAWPHEETLKESLKLYNIQHRLGDYSPEDIAEALSLIGYKIKDYLLEIFHIPKNSLNLNSPSSITDRLLAKSFLASKFNKVPDSVQEKYFSHIHTPWVQTSIIGTQRDFLDADVNKAYAWSAINTPYLGPERNKYIRDAEYHPEAIGGMVKIRATVDSTPINPVTLRIGANPVSVQGDIIDWYTKREVDEFREGNWASNIKILDGVWVIPTDEAFFPFKNLESILHIQEDAISKYTSPALHTICRMIYTRFIGKTRTVLESEGEYKEGPFFSPIFFSEIQARTKVQIAKEIRLNNLIESTSFVHTDGFGGTYPGLKTPRSSKVPGEMEWTRYEEALIMSASIKDIKGLKGDYTGIRAIMEEYPSLPRVEIPRESRVSFLDAVEWGKLSYISKLFRGNQVFKVGNTRKRNFPDMPTRNKDMLANSYKSYPLNVEEWRHKKKNNLKEEQRNDAPNNWPG